MKPRYKEIPQSKIPTETKNGNVTVKVIAGESLGAKAVINTITPIVYLYFKLESDASIVQSVPTEYNVFAYVIKGKGIFEQRNNGNKIIERGHLVIFDTDGEKYTLKLLKILQIHLNYC